MTITKVLIAYIVHYWAFILAFIVIFSIISNIILEKNYWKYLKFVKNIHWYILIWWAFNNWKTRLLTLLAKEASKVWKFIITNFSNWYNNLRFSSKNDFWRLVNDIMIISEYQNYNDDEILEVYEGMWKEFIMKKIKEREFIRRKYPFIPYNTYPTEFFIWGDEWHAYFFSREAMSNFTGESKDWNITLHQIRHFNAQWVFATQEIEDLDKKFRTLATYEIDTYDKLKWILVGWNIFKYNWKKKYIEEEKEFNRINRLPIIDFNGYVLNKIVDKINYVYFDKINKLLLKLKINKKLFITKRFYQLKFFSKSNVNPKLDIYKSKDLFVSMNKYYKAKNW